MNARLDELIQRRLEGSATVEETAALQEALKDNAEARALYLDYMNLDAALSAVADAGAVGEGVIRESSFAQRSRFPWWWVAAAAACVALAISVGLLPSRKQLPARLDLTAALKSAQKAIARMPAPSESSMQSWMSPTASLLDPDLSRLPSINSKQQP